MTHRLLPRRLALVLAVTLLAAACASAPPNLSPTGVADFTATRVIKGLDGLMDVAIAAEAQKLLTVATTRRVVEYHQVAVKVIVARPAGWSAQVLTGLDGTVATFSPGEQQMLSAYVALVKALLKEVQ